MPNGVNMENAPLQVLNLTSISGIVIATTMIVEIIKRFLCYPFFKKIPVWIYSVIVASGLAILANKVLKTDDGTPMLAGNTWKVVWAAIVAAASASGFYTWMKNPEPLETASTLSKGNTMTGAKSVIRMIGPITLILLAGGCQAVRCPEKAVLRESMDQATRTIRQTQQEWAQKLAIDPATGKNHCDQIPPVTDTQLKNIMQAHKEYEDLVNADRANDQK